MLSNLLGFDRRVGEAEVCQLSWTNAILSHMMQPLQYINAITETRKFYCKQQIGSKCQPSKHPRSMSRSEKSPPNGVFCNASPPRQIQMCRKTLESLPNIVPRRGISFPRSPASHTHVREGHKGLRTRLRASVFQNMYIETRAGVS